MCEHMPQTPVISMKKPDLYNHAERKSWQEDKSEKRYSMN